MLEATEHPNITRIFELLEDNFNYYIVMEYVTGRNLLEKMIDMQRFTEAQAGQVI